MQSSTPTPLLPCPCGITPAELAAFLDRVSAYFDYSTSPLGMEARALLARLAPAPDAGEVGR